MQFEGCIGFLKNLSSMEITDRTLFEAIDHIEVNPYIYKFLERISKDLPPKVPLIE
jgi:hypothetical protein